MWKSASRLVPVFLLVLLFVFRGHAQDPGNSDKPYKIMTSGRQLTIKSAVAINQVMLWTISGNRVVERKGISTTSCVVDIPVYQKAFYLMIGLNNGKVYTEKIGVNN